ncbi:MAG TPA: hypothetical protein VLB68_29120 [Pyrinomonadaceae bacterium]|nr:hypothetical protein [Pyrinomonadaceae bacterium]
MATERAKLYESYRVLILRHDTEPLSFRRFLEVMDEYDREWEVAGYEYEKAAEYITED